MKKALAMVLGAIGMLAAGFAATGSWWGVFDEPEMPKTLNK